MELIQFLHKWGGETVTLMKKRISSTQNYSGYDRSQARILDQFNPRMVKDADTIKWELELPGYAKFVDEGRPPGKMPPEQPIMSWILDRKIKPEGSYRNLLWGTRKIIAGRGVVGSNFFEVFDRRLDTLYQPIEEYIISEFDKKFREIKNNVER